MSYTIAVAGKGGTGKTTISSLVVRHFVRAGKTPVFAVDADANYNLNDQLGVEVKRTIGGSREEMKRKIRPTRPRPGMSKDDWIEMQMSADLIESEGFDLLVMGRPEGPGCYCAANNTLRRHLEILSDNYPVVVIDNEAGMEHLSRRTTAKIDLLLLVSEPSPVGIMTAARIRDLAREMEIAVARTGLVINRVPTAALACASSRRPAATASRCSGPCRSTRRSSSRRCRTCRRSGCPTTRRRSRRSKRCCPQ